MTGASTTPLHAPAAADARPAGPEHIYFELLRRGTWSLPRCEACTRVVFYPRAVCPHCGGEAFAWEAPSGRGVIHSTTVMRRGAKAGGDLNLCLVDLAEGVRMMSRVRGVPPERPRIGDDVRAVIEQAADGPLVVFELVEARA